MARRTSKNHAKPRQTTPNRAIHRDYSGTPPQTSEFSRGLPPAGVGIRRFSGQVWMYHSAQKLKERFILYHFASFAV
ncbi:MAG TPA: hypothetical protein VK797_22555, partial [Tepidisphaeraceae bacterium]|nr:hypothetical protein [Tepidisphaeraceae bacterium]